MKDFIREILIRYYKHRMLNTDGAERVRNMQKMMIHIRLRDSAQVLRMESKRGLR